MPLSRNNLDIENHTILRRGLAFRGGRKYPCLCLKKLKGAPEEQKGTQRGESVI